MLPNQISEINVIKMCNWIVYIYKLVSKINCSFFLSFAVINDTCIMYIYTNYSKCELNKYTIKFWHLLRRWIVSLYVILYIIIVLFLYKYIYTSLNRTKYLSDRQWCYVFKWLSYVLT